MKDNPLLHPQPGFLSKPELLTRLQPYLETSVLDQAPISWLSFKQKAENSLLSLIHKIHTLMLIIHTKNMQLLLLQTINH